MYFQTSPNRDIITRKKKKKHKYKILKDNNKEKISAKYWGSVTNNLGELF